jgi:PEGA domain
MHFQQYLAGAKNIPPERRAEVKKDIARISSKLAKLVVESPVPGARVSVDGVHVGTTPLDKTIPVEPGGHHVVLSRSGYDDFVLDINAPAGETYRLSAKLAKAKPTNAVADAEEPRRQGGGAGAAPSAPIAREAAPAQPGPPVVARPTTSPAPPPAKPAPAAPAATTIARAPSPEAAPAMHPTAPIVGQTDTERHEEGLSKAWFWTGVGTTVVLAGTTVALGSVALSRSNEYNDPTTTPTRKMELLSSGPGLAHATDALLAATVVSAGVTVWLYFKTDWGVTPTPNGVAVAGRF